MQGAGKHHGQQGNEQHSPAEGCAALPLLTRGWAAGQGVGGAERAGAGGDPADRSEAPEEQNDEEDLLEELVKGGDIETVGD